MVGGMLVLHCRPLPHSERVWWHQHIKPRFVQWLHCGGESHVHITSCFFSPRWSSKPRHQFQGRLRTLGTCIVRFWWSWSMRSMKREVRGNL